MNAVKSVSTTLAASKTGAILERPFHFTIVCWGKQYTNYFLEYCLPSLLSPGNIPAISTRQQSKFLIATRPEDWEEMQQSPIFKRLKEYILPVYVEIPACPPDKSPCEHMGIGHKLVCDLGHEEQAYSVMVTPDSMLSDGTVSRLVDLARQGYELVLVSALRFGEEPFLGHLNAIGAIPQESRRESGRPLIISGRQMVFAAINGFHSETLRYEWDTAYFAAVPAAAWWRVPGEYGIVVHSLSWAPLLFDYAAVGKHDTSALDTWTIDGDYTHKNLGDSKAIYVIQDSDEAFISSWAPLSDKAQRLEPNPMFTHSVRGAIAKGAQFREVFYSSIYDPLKRRIFFRPVRWHSYPLNDKWTKVERKALRSLYQFVTPGLTQGAEPSLSSAEKRIRLQLLITESFWRSATITYSFISKQSLPTANSFVGVLVAASIIWSALLFPFRLARLIPRLWTHRRSILGRFRQALAGDWNATQRIISRIQITILELLAHSPTNAR